MTEEDFYAVLKEAYGFLLDESRRGEYYIGLNDGVHAVIELFYRRMKEKKEEKDG